MAAPTEYPARMVAPLIQVRPTKIADILYICKYLRKADRAEILANSGSTPLDSLTRALYKGLLCFTGFREGRPIAIFGTSAIVPDEDETNAWIFMVGTDELTAHPKELMEMAKEWLPVLSLGADACMNYVDSRNTSHVRWLKRLGFELNEEEPVFLSDPKVPFFSFSKETSHV